METSLILGTTVLILSPVFCKDKNSRMDSSGGRPPFKDSSPEDSCTSFVFVPVQVKDRMSRVILITKLAVR